MSVTVEIAAGPRKVTTKFGNVIVSGLEPSGELVSAHVKRSTEALERLCKKLTKPGVYLPEKKDVPHYWADENERGVFIRRLNGKVTTGKLQNGQFVETK